eukprot:Opistho-2@31748
MALTRTAILAAAVMALVATMAIADEASDDYTLLIPAADSFIEGEPFEVSVQSQNGAAIFEWEYSYTDVEDWKPLNSISSKDRKITITVSGDRQRTTLTLREAVSRWLQYRFRCSYIFDAIPAEKRYTDDVFVDLAQTNQVIFQAPQRNMADGKQIAEYWTTPDVPQPAFRRLAFRTLGKTSAGGTGGYFLNLVSSNVDPTDLTAQVTGSLSLTTSIGPDSYFEVIDQYCALKLTRSPITSAEALNIKTNVPGVIEARMRNAGLGFTSLKFFFANDIQPVRSSDQNKEYTILFYMRDYTTGMQINNGVIRRGLGLAATSTVVAGENSEVTDRSIPAQDAALTSLSTALGTAITGVVAKFELYHYATIRSASNFFLRAANPTTMETKITEFASDENLQWFLNSNGDSTSTEPLPFQSLLTKFNFKSKPFGSFLTLKITGFDGQSTPQAITTFALDPAQANASPFSYTDTPAFLLTDSGVNGEVPWLWAAQRCAEYTSESRLVQNVQACQALPNNPTYRRLELDLNGFFGVTTVSIAMPNYPFPSDPLLWAASLPKFASNSTKSRLELWGSTDGLNYVDLTDSVNSARTTCSNGEPTKAGQPCTVAFAVQDYTRSVLGKSGNFGWRYFRIVFGGMERQSDRLLTADRYFAASEIKFTGYCICNGHSNKCDIKTGRCYEADAIVANQPDDIFRCQHWTTGDHCDQCAPNTYVNYANDEPRDSYNCNVTSPDFQCDGPLLSEITPVEVESLQYRYGALRGNPVVVVDNSNVRFQYALAFQVFYSVAGPCVQCFCYGHSIYDDRTNLADRTIQGCNNVNGACFCSASSHTVNGDEKKCELCADAYCRTCDSRPSALGFEACRGNDCKACFCNGHATVKTGAGADKCDPDGCGCTCIAGDNVDGDECENCKPGYFSNTGNGKNSVSCTQCSCNGHKPAGVVGTFEECDVLGGNCDMDDSKCIDNTEGHNCQCCKPGFFRDSNDATLPCKPCACNGHGDATATWDFKNGCGVQAAECNPIGGVCACKVADHVHGDHCESCNVGYWNAAGDSKDGKTCTACFCFGHKGVTNECAVKGGDCNFKYDGTTPDKCAGNTVGASCEVCKPSFKYNDRTKVLNPVGTNFPVAPVTDIRFESCSACNCNGHSKENPDVGSGICDPVTGICINCGDNTANGADGECERCSANFFRNLNTKYDRTKDTCDACALTGGDCAAETLASSCRPCSGQCFGPNKACDEFTGECTSCTASNARGYRCERCVPGFYGEPKDGIQCEKCLCYQSEPSLWKWIANRNSVLSAPLRCDLDKTLEPRGCVLDQTALTPAIIAAVKDQTPTVPAVYSALTAAISCNCPADINNGTFNVVPYGSVYTGRQCSGCNNQAYFGRPTTCRTPNALAPLLPNGGCSEFFSCISCVCNRNIDESQAISNCNYDATSHVASGLRCTKCKGNTIGEECEQCDSGYYGNAKRTDTAGKLGTGYVLDNAGESLKCFKCDCNGQSVVRKDGLAGIPGDVCDTVGAANKDNFVCQCREDLGYIGAKCRQCKRGYQLKKGFNGDGQPDPLYDYCEPCPLCVLNVYSEGVIPLENAVWGLRSDLQILNASVSLLGGAVGGGFPDSLVTVLTTLRDSVDNLKLRVAALEGGNPANLCAVNPCQNGGSCAVVGNSVVCSCAGIAKGQFCEDNVDQCAGNPCQNGGTCTDGLNDYSCACTAAFTGKSCANAVITPCNPNPCQNGGVCSGEGVCACVNGYTGATCTSISTSIHDGVNALKLAANPIGASLVWRSTWSVSLYFRATDPNGVILYVYSAEVFDYISLYLKNGRLNFEVNAGVADFNTGNTRAFVDGTFTDGSWNKVTLTRTSTGITLTAMKADGSSAVTQTTLNRAGPVAVDAITNVYLGNGPAGSPAPFKAGLMGSIRFFRINDQSVNLSAGIGGNVVAQNDS